MCAMHRVFCDARACVICRGYDSIPLSVRLCRELKVAPRIVFSSSLTEEVFCPGRFLFWRNLYADDKTMAALRLRIKEHITDINKKFGGI